MSAQLSAGLPRSVPGRRPLAERIAGWSAAHHNAAAAGWLLPAFTAVAGQPDRWPGAPEGFRT